MLYVYTIWYDNKGKRLDLGNMNGLHNVLRLSLYCRLENRTLSDRKSRTENWNQTSSSRLITITCIRRGERALLKETTWRQEYVLDNVEAVPHVLGCHNRPKWSNVAYRYRWEWCIRVVGWFVVG